MTGQRDVFWGRIPHIAAGMLGVRPELKLVPMAHHVDAPLNALWFISANGVELVEQVKQAPQEALFVVGDSSAKIWARISGLLSLSDDRAKLAEIWTHVASTWFEGGKQDPDIRLLKLTLAEAEVWTTSGSLGFFYEVAKAQLTGNKPDMGEHFRLTF